MEPSPQSESFDPATPSGAAARWVIEAGSIHRGETIWDVEARVAAWQTESLNALTRPGSDDAAPRSPIERSVDIIEALPARVTEWTETTRWYRIAANKVTESDHWDSTEPVVWTLRVRLTAEGWRVDGLDHDPALDAGD